jgi:starvation-inducible DNA-binding protein
MALTKMKSSSADIDIGINGKLRKEVAHATAQMLAATYALQLKTQYYHWNVTGENFIALHELLGKQYDELAAAVDELAERIRALGSHAPGTFREFSELTSLKEDKMLPPDWQTMVENLTEAHEIVAKSAREKIEIAQKCGDEGTADLFIRRLQEHEKTAWMLRSHLQ